MLSSVGGPIGFSGKRDTMSPCRRMSQTFTNLVLIINILVIFTYRKLGEDFQFDEHRMFFQCAVQPPTSKKFRKFPDGWLKVIQPFSSDLFVRSLVFLGVGSWKNTSGKWMVKFQGFKCLEPRSA